MAAHQNRPPRKTPAKRSRPKSGKPNGMNSIQPILIGLALIVLAFFVWRKGREQPAPESLAAKPSPEEPRIISSNKQLQQAQNASSQRSQLLVQERAAGLAPLPVKSGKDSLELTIRSRAFVRGCTRSDLDIMERDQTILKRSDPGFILSVENLDPAAKHKPQQRPVSLKELKAGIQHTFSIPVNQKRGTWGIFLCTQGQDKSCKDQLKTSLADLDLLQTDILSKQKPLSAYPAQDKVFFFHFMVAYKDRLLLHDPMQSLDSSFERLEAALEKGGGEPVSPSLLQQAKQWLQAIGSLPALVMGEALELQLPHQGERCL